MALLPVLFDGLHPIRRSLVANLLDSLLDDDLVSLQRPQSNFLERESSAIVNKDTFHASIDVQQFKPEEITVKLTGKNTVTVEGKHEEKQDEHGYISRHFVRKYVLPEDYDADKVQSKLSSDGVLNIIAPKKPEHKQLECKEIPITLTGPIKSLGHKGEKKLKPKRLAKKGPYTIKRN